MTKEQLLFVGRLTSIPNGQAFGFIEKESIRRLDGEPHGLTFEKNVFIHQQSCGPTLQIGLNLEFALVADPDEGEGCYRAVGAKQIPAIKKQPPQEVLVEQEEASLVTVPKDLPNGALALYQPTRAEYHNIHHAKPIPDEAVRKVVENKPFCDLLGGTSTDTVQCESRDHLIHFSNAYLLHTFPHIVNGCGIQCDIASFDGAASSKIMREAIQDNKDLGAEGQATYLETEYARYVMGIRLLQWVVESDIIKPGMLIGQHTIAGILALIQDNLPTNEAQQKKRFDATYQVLSFVAKQEMLSPLCILPMRFLPDLYCACPVLFEISSEPDAFKVAWQQDNPFIPESVVFLCERFLGNDRWYNLVQLWNRRMRSMKQYQRCESIPAHIRKMIKIARKELPNAKLYLFTPYHDLAGKDLTNLQWLRPNDPYLVLFEQYFQGFAVIGRYSDTGIFPLYHELVADSMDFLQQHKHLLRNFGSVHEPRWFVTRENWESRSKQGKYDNARKNGTLYFHKNNLGDCLTTLADEMLQAYQQGILFDWIRKEAELPSDKPINQLPEANKAMANI